MLLQTNTPPLSATQSTELNAKQIPHKLNVLDHKETLHLWAAPFPVPNDQS